MVPFQNSSTSITLRNNHFLHCFCQKPDGSYECSQIDLNDCLGNNNGKFVWGGDNFANNASQIHLSIEGEAGVPYLHAQLNDRKGSVQSASVNLGECIRNEAGALEYGAC
ncbi:CVNH domain protein [Aspergillus sclerotialis]|uniref:CVNH domain protein n=1 Tax=Aspergillus sclerotialis TaxID=2070753 RepID=A0A3A2ZUF0_9EURO|nr:CVNH domain protein [Aspergillus sclerotialis]